MLPDRWRHFINCLPKGVNLLAVSKGHPSSSIRCLAELGQIDFGESRLQEAIPKVEELKDLSFLRWHFIGHLQKNKVRGVVQTFQVIHSVNSFALAERISRIAVEEERCPQVMLQVKFLEDPNKGGFAPDQLSELWPRLIDLPNVRLTGLMTMAPKNLDLIQTRTLFKNCREFANQLDLPDCSMGMSQDWQVGVEVGATWLRLGSALFGARPDNLNLLTD